MGHGLTRGVTGMPVDSSLTPTLPVGGAVSRTSGGGSRAAGSVGAMVARIVIAVVLLVVVGAVALILERRRRDRTGPVADPYPVPRQLYRTDFVRPEAPWLVALFSSTTCEGCDVMRERVAALESPEVATVDVSWQAARDVHERYRIAGVPTVVVADQEGVVHRAFVGAVTATDLWAAVAAARDPSLDIAHGLDALG